MRKGREGEPVQKCQAKKDAVMMYKMLVPDLKNIVPPTSWREVDLKNEFGWSPSFTNLNSKIYIRLTILMHNNVKKKLFSVYIEFQEILKDKITDDINVKKQKNKTGWIVFHSPPKINVPSMIFYTHMVSWSLEAAGFSN